MKSVKSNHIENLEKYVYNYYNGIADNYDQIINKHYYCYDRIKRLLRHLIPINCNVLEIGCGIGQNLISLNPNLGVGIDFSIHFISQFRQLSKSTKKEKLAEKTIQSVGYPILLDAGSNMGFGALVFSSFIPVQYIGGLMIFAMISTSFGTLIILASCMEIFKNYLIN